MKYTLPISALTMVLLALAPTSFAVETDPTSMPCGEWDDVSSKYMDAITDVCEKGIMGGMGSSNFDGEFGISRAMAATVGSRIALGPDNYNSSDSTTSFYSGQLDNYFTDIPPSETWNEWILKAMYYARINYLMTGDGNPGNSLTTFRYQDDVTTAEFLKILFEAAHSRGVLNNYGGSNLSYTGNPWYSDIVALYDGLGIWTNYSLSSSNSFVEFRFHYDTSDSSQYQTIRLGLNETISRENAAYLIYEMMDQNIMDDPNVVSMM